MIVRTETKTEQQNRSQRIDQFVDRENQPIKPFCLHRPVVFTILAALAIGGSFFADDFFNDIFRTKANSGQLNATLHALRFWGEGVTLVFFAWGMIAICPKRWKSVVAIAVSVLVVAGTVDLFKPLVARARPSEADAIAKAEAASESSSDSEMSQSMPEQNTWNSSFPSGHTATAFSFASGIAWYHPALRSVAIVAASGTAASRMHDRRHYFSDCVAGAIYGWFLTSMMLYWWQRRTMNLL